jgi:hypothetical protein
MAKYSKVLGLSPPGTCRRSLPAHYRAGGLGRSLPLILGEAVVGKTVSLRAEATGPSLRNEE